METFECEPNERRKSAAPSGPEAGGEEKQNMGYNIKYGGTAPQD